MELRRLAILSSVFACFSTTAPAFARTLVVDNDTAECPQAEYNTIQQAVAAAEAGDKILVCPGPYFGTVLVDKPNLRIEAQAAPGEVVLQGTGAVGELGFHLLDTTSVVLQGFTVQGFGRAQIRIEGGRGNTVRKNVTRDAVVNDGIQVIRSSANVVEQNTSHGNREDGIFLGQIPGILGELVFDNIIRHNETFNNRHGINLNGTGSGNVVFGNRSYGNVQRGIQNLNSHANVYENNHVFENGNIGMLIANNSRDVTVRNNRLENNTIDGIRVAAGATNNLVEKNELFRNVQNGIMLNNNAPANIIRLNLIRLSGIDGIRVNDQLSGGNTIERNVMRENVEHDAHDNSAGPGTAGTANFWINNKCETDNRGGLLCEHPGH